jgi:two-component system, sensor histidine kinase and response regulator
MTTAIVVVACIVAIYLIGVATIRANAAVQRHRIVAEHLQQFLSTLKDAETGQRGFVLTGKPSYLTPYNEAKSRIDQESQELAHNVQRGELSADDVNRLKKLTSQKMSELQETIDLRNSRGFEPAEALIASDRGKRTMDAIRSLLGTMTEREDAALEGSRRRADLFVESSALIVAISALLSLAVLAWGYQQIKQESRAREAGAVELLRAEEFARSDVGLDWRRGDRGQQRRANHFPQRSRRAPHGMARRRGYRAAVRDGLQHRQRGDAAGRRKPG